MHGAAWIHGSWDRWRIWSNRSRADGATDDRAADYDWRARDRSPSSGKRRRAGKRCGKAKGPSGCCNYGQDDLVHVAPPSRCGKRSKSKIEHRPSCTLVVSQKDRSGSIALAHERAAVLPKAGFRPLSSKASRAHPRARRLFRVPTPSCPRGKARLTRLSFRQLGRAGSKRQFGRYWVLPFGDFISPHRHS